MITQEKVGSLIINKVDLKTSGPAILVHDGKQVMSICEGLSRGFLQTIHTVFEGTKEEVDAEIQRIGLTRNEVVGKRDRR